MIDSYMEQRSHENIRAVILPNKEQYYWDLLNIEHSWSGRLDSNICNTFIMEAEQQIVNAVELFEQGYFDCAYYSLRSAVDVSTTMVFLSDMPDEDRERYLEAWKSTSDFPMQGQMVRDLSRYGSIFTDMLKKMPLFFSNAKNLSAELNKYVHKQGLQHFYVSRNHPLNQNKPQDTFISTFESYLRRCIGVVAVMRLAIDPFPILLMDEDILYRCFDSMTDPYTDEFVEKYIGASTIECYKQTDLYSSTYESFLTEEKKNDAVFSVMKHQYIDTGKLEDIFSQLYLLSRYDIICVLIVAASEKAVKVYCIGGIHMFFTDRNTNRKTLSWSSADFNEFCKNENLINQKYDEAYISVFIFDNDEYFMEHNEPISQEEANTISQFVTEKLTCTEQNRPG